MIRTRPNFPATVDVEDGASEHLLFSEVAPDFCWRLSCVTNTTSGTNVSRYARIIGQRSPSTTLWTMTAHPI